MPEPVTAELIGVDWGLSRMRAMRIGREGEVLEVREAHDGVLTGHGPYEARLRGHLSGWVEQHPRVPILMSGMVGSDRGWAAAPYIPTPAGVQDLARRLLRVESSLAVHIVPGVSQTTPAFDVMRGEETQIAGFIAQHTGQQALLCLPGTHSKWVQLSEGRITGFRTHITGELRALLLAQSTLAVGDVQSSDADIFRRALIADGSLTHVLFGCRAERMLGHLKPEWTAAYISGALLGAEVRSERVTTNTTTPVFLLASGDLAESYAAALVELGWTFSVVDTQALAARGLMMIARAAGLLETVDA